MLGVTYFPNDNIDKEKSENLIGELTENISVLKSKGFECMLMGDFNGTLPCFRAQGKQIIMVTC